LTYLMEHGFDHFLTAVGTMKIFFSELALPVKFHRSKKKLGMKHFLHHVK
jgi:hypothetical protein